MWDKFRDYCLDVSKYFLTVIFVTSFVDDFREEEHWLIYALSLFIGVGLLGLAWFFNQKDKDEKVKNRKKYKQYNNKNRRN